MISTSENTIYEENLNKLLGCKFMSFHCYQKESIHVVRYEMHVKFHWIVIVNTVDQEMYTENLSILYI